LPALDRHTDPNAKVQLPAKGIHHDARAVCDFHNPLKQLSTQAVCRDVQLYCRKAARESARMPITSVRTSEISASRTPDRRQEIAHEAASNRGKARFSVHRIHIGATFGRLGSRG